MFMSARRKAPRVIFWFACGAQSKSAARRDSEAEMKHIIWHFIDVSYRAKTHLSRAYSPIAFHFTANGLSSAGGRVRTPFARYEMHILNCVTTQEHPSQKHRTSTSLWICTYDRRTSSFHCVTFPFICESPFDRISFHLHNNAWLSLQIGPCIEYPSAEAAGASAGGVWAFGRGNGWEASQEWATLPSSALLHWEAVDSQSAAEAQRCGL